MADLDVDQERQQPAQVADHEPVALRDRAGSDADLGGQRPRVATHDRMVTFSSASSLSARDARG
jgi:hypothetical protein